MKSDQALFGEAQFLKKNSWWIESAQKVKKWPKNEAFMVLTKI